MAFMKLSCFWLVAWSLHSIVSSLATAGDPNGRVGEPDLDVAIKAVGDARDAFNGWKAYKALFRTAGASRLANLEALPNDSIAIQAAWQEVAQTVPERGSGVDVRRPRRAKLDWFVGFFEGRMRVRAPKWWCEGILAVRANSPGSIYFPAELSNRIGATRSSATVTKKNGRFVLQLMNDSISLPAMLVEEISDEGRGLREHFNAVFTRVHSYIVIDPGAGYPYALACVDRATGKVVWKIMGWGSLWGGTGRPTGQDHLEIEVQNDRVLVYGISGLGKILAEAFRADNGQSLFRFSTAYTEWHE